MLLWKKLHYLYYSKSGPYRTGLKNYFLWSTVIGDKYICLLHFTYNISVEGIYLTLKLLRNQLYKIILTGETDKVCINLKIILTVPFVFSFKPWQCKVVITCYYQPILIDVFRKLISFPGSLRRSAGNQAEDLSTILTSKPALRISEPEEHIKIFKNLVYVGRSRKSL